MAKDLWKEPTHEERVSEGMGRCRHYSGLLRDDACRAGVPYDSVKVFNEPRGTGISLPCLKDSAKVPCHCDKAEYPTREESEQEIRDRDESVNRLVERVGIARPAIMADVKARGAMRKDVRGAITCPICGAENALRYTRAGSYNGHVHAKCETAGCVQWGE